MGGATRPTASARRHAWFVLAASFVVAVGYNAYVIAPASVLPRLSAEFGVDKPTAGLAISAVYVSWAALQLPGGLSMDRYDNRRLVVAGVLLYFVAAGAGAVAGSYPLFLLSRVVGGVCAVFVWTASANIVRQSFPADSRALGTSLFVASAPAGFALAQFTGPLVAARFGWRAVFVTYPLVTLVGLPVFLLAASEPVRNETSLSTREFRRALRDPSVLAVSGASFCAYSVFLFFNSWMPSYATEVLGVDLATAGAAAALVPVSGVLARPGGGWLSDRLGGRRAAVIAASLALSVPVLAALTLVESAAAFGGLLLVAGFTAQLGTGVFYVYVAELVDDDIAGTSLALLTTLSVLGSLVTPIVTGWLVQYVSWVAAFAYVAALAVAGVALVGRAS